MKRIPEELKTAAFVIVTMGTPVVTASPKTLAARQRDLGRAGVVARRAHAEIPPRVEYRLTTAGREFWRSATPFVAWAARQS